MGVFSFGRILGGLCLHRTFYNYGVFYSLKVTKRWKEFERNGVLCLLWNWEVLLLLPKYFTRRCLFFFPPPYLAGVLGVCFLYFSQQAYVFLFFYYFFSFFPPVLNAQVQLAVSHP
ncbi:hypothetical protein QBC43DRAFT_127299 [Cladorrhinum sp. PSN259]|nr:hypothetical protein QBC43DRAFT_127299 [Cladorrhinum sp. PSN259]